MTQTLFGVYAHRQNEVWVSGSFFNAWASVCLSYKIKKRHQELGRLILQASKLREPNKGWKSLWSLNYGSGKKDFHPGISAVRFLKNGACDRLIGVPPYCMCVNITHNYKGIRIQVSSTNCHLDLKNKTKNLFSEPLVSSLEGKTIFS